jgi:alpha-beta hydrolase superfamily lysophospholipase
LLVDLVQTTTRDGFRLDGALRTAAAAPTLPLDALCLLHGTGGNFYSSTLFDRLADHLVGLGCAVLRVNTRGHDGVSNAATTAGGRRQGAAYEVVDHCRHDVAAWLAWLRQQVGPRVGLIGHSLGAVKALYALCHEPDDTACIVALSPPRLSYSWFCSGPERDEFLATYGRAELLAAETPSALLEVRLPLPMAIAAAGYLEKYGPEERYNYLKFAACVPCPTLFTFGGLEVENNVAFRGAPEAVADRARGRSRLTVQVVPAADHFYTVALDDVVGRVADWLARLPASSS